MVVLDADGRRLDGYTISSASKPNSSGELKISEITIFSFFTVMKNYRINSQCVMMWLLLWHSLNFLI